MDEVSKSELKAKMFEYLRKVEKTGRPLVVKNFGEPTLIISPYRETKSIAEVFADARVKASFNRAAILSSEADEWSDDL